MIQANWAVAVQISVVRDCRGMPFVNRRLEVRFLSPAPHHPSVGPASLIGWVAVLITLIERHGSLIAPVCLKTAVGALRSLSNPLTWSFPVGLSRFSHALVLCEAPP